MLNAGRKYLGSGDLAGKVFVTSGLGGMSGAQAKAAVICGCVGVVAEVHDVHYALRFLRERQHFEPGQHTCRYNSQRTDRDRALTSSNDTRRYLSTDRSNCICPV